MEVSERTRRSGGSTRLGVWGPGYNLGFIRPYFVQLGRSLDISELQFCYLKNFGIRINSVGTSNTKVTGFIIEVLGESFGKKVVVAAQMSIKITKEKI